MKHTVRLDFHSCDDFGTGLVNHKAKPSTDYSGEQGKFNPFWITRGIFHDVFEHYFEEEHKYFRGKYAYNWVGEIVAMGHMTYYLEHFGHTDMGFDRQPNRSVHDLAAETTLDDLHEIIIGREDDSPANYYGDTLLSCIPRKVLGPSAIEQADEYMYLLKERCEGKVENEAMYKSITRSKIANAHQQGYSMAEKLVPYYGNFWALGSFTELFNIITKLDSEHLAKLWQGVEVTINKKVGGYISWKVKFISVAPTEFKDITYRYEDYENKDKVIIDSDELEYPATINDEE